MKALADYVSSKGMKLGLYGDIGTSTCGGFIGFNISAVPDQVCKHSGTVDTCTLICHSHPAMILSPCHCGRCKTRSWRRTLRR